MTHYFISYSHVDGEELAVRLAEALAPLPVWRDEALRPGEQWDAPLAEAIGTCKALLFLMTPDSVGDESFCKTEWAYALQCRKPVIPLRMHSDAQLPFRLTTWDHEDFTKGFDAAAARLREHLVWLDSPEGQLHLVEQRIRHAQRELAAESRRGAAEELEELRQRREELLRVARDPEGAARRVRANVRSAQERERTEGVNPPPMVAPPYFQNRFDETAQLEAFLDDESLRLMVVAGRGGIGKSALVCRLLRDIPRVVYLSHARSTHRVTLPDLYASVVTLLPEETAARVDAIYRDPASTPRQTIEALAQAFARVRTIILLDNFEDTLDSETTNVRDGELDEALRALLELPPHGLKVILTTRIVPRELLMVRPERQQRLDLDAGLESPYAEKLLRGMDRDGKLGLRDAPDALLAAARERTRGHPRALEHLAGILSADRDTTLEEILESTSGMLPESVVNALVGEAFSRLDTLAQRVMQALAVYRTAVPTEAVDHLLEVETARVLSRLVNMRFVHGERKRYSLHPVDREYALSHIDAESLRDLRLGAAEWFAGARKPQEAWKSLEDLAPQLAEFELRCEARDDDGAAALLLSFGAYVALWGHYRLLVDLLRRVQRKIASPELAANTMAALAAMLVPLGQSEEAARLYEEAIDAARRHGLPSEGVMLVDLAGIRLGQSRILAAVELLDRANTRMRELDRYDGVSHVSVHQANALLQIGRPEEARERMREAIELVRLLGDRQSEAGFLAVQAAVQIALGELDEALDSCRSAVEIATDLGFRQGIASARTFMTLIHTLREEWTEGEQAIDEAIAIADDLQLPQWQKLARETAATLALGRNAPARARALCDTARRYDAGPAPFSSALLGITALRQHDPATARQAFRKAIDEANQLLALTPQLHLAHDAVGLASCGLALCGDRDRAAQAKRAFASARGVTAHPGTVRAVLLLFDALARADSEGILAEVRPLVAGGALGGD